MENIDDIQLGLTKFRANSSKYFSLFDKYIPRFENDGKGRKILMLGLSNESMMLKCCVLNKNAKYFVADLAILSETLPAIGSEYDFSFFDSNLDLYDIIKDCDMKFDCIIMNPPYERNLHLKILAEAITHLKDNESKVVNLSPIRWLQDPLAKFKEKNDYHRFENKISKHCTNITIIKTENARNLFKAELLQPLGIYCADKSINNNIYKTIFKVPDFINRVFRNIIEQSNFKKLTTIKYNDNLQHFVLINIMAPPMKYGKPMFDAVKTWCGYFCNGKNQNGLTYRQAKELNTRATRGCIDQDTAVVFNTANEAKNCYESMQTKFVRFFVMTSVVDVHVHQEYLPWMSDSINPRTSLKGYESKWTDQDFYMFFNITEDEQKIIEDTMAKYK